VTGIEPISARAISARAISARAISARAISARAISARAISVEQGGIGEDGAARKCDASAVHHVLGVYHLRPTANFVKMPA
jgi:hypothetical protein